MRNRDRRMKASDIYAKPFPFEQEFPQIESFRIEVKEIRSYNDRSSKVPRTHIYTATRPPEEYVDCSNPFCYGGSFSIRTIIRDMVKKRETERETTEICQGSLGSPKGKIIVKPCFNSFEVKLSLTYKEEESEVNVN